MADPPRDDAALLRRFQANQDEAAFGELVRRHGPLVWGVCRRRLERLEDAEDAFQTTFLILAIKAGTIRRPEALAGWLHRTATRVARRVATKSPRKPGDEQHDAGLDALAEITKREMIAAVDDELQALPGQYRDALVLFHLEGLPRQEVADRLGVSEPTIKARLTRGRSLLRTRLARRGVALPLLLPLATDPLPAGAAESATRLGTTFGRTRVTPGDLLTTTLTQGAHPMLSLITGKTGLAVLAVCLGLTVVWAVREPLRAGDGDEARGKVIVTALDADIEKSKPMPVALLNQTEDQSDEAEEPNAVPDDEASDAATAPDAPDQTVEGAMEPASTEFYALGTTEPVREILDALDEPTRIEFAGIPLRDALAALGTQHEINVVLDENVIHDDGAALNNNVDLFLNGVSLRSGLDLMLDPEGLTYVIDNEVLFITTKAAAESRYETRAYPVPTQYRTLPEEEFTERLKTLMVARGAATEPVIDIFNNRIVVVAPLKDHEHLREILRLIYMETQATEDEGSFL